MRFVLPPHPPDAAREKLRRARVHLETLNDQIRSYNSNPDGEFLVSTEFDANPGRNLFYVVGSPAPLPDDWPLKG